VLGEPQRVELVRVGALPPGALRELARRLVEAAPWEVVIAEGGVEPRPAFDAFRQQYSAQALLSFLLEPPPGPRVRRLGVTHVDLFVPVFTHLFGYGLLGGRAALVSLFRLRPEVEGDAPDPARLAERLAKEALHELGHTFGLMHCPVPWCAMKSSRYAEEVDLKDAAYCPACLRVIQEGGACRFHDARLEPPRIAG
jgi:archaemetzincin